MSTGVELASAWVRLVPSLDGAQAAITKELGGVSDKVAATGKPTGTKFGAALAGGIAGGVAALASTALSGIKDMVGQMTAQVDSTQKFKSTLEFADISDKNVARLTKSTKKYADQTVYSLSDIRNITSQLASNGVKDFDKLAEAGGNLNAIAGGNAETFKSVGMVITQTAGQGKLTAENWNQLSDAIPGASGKIQEALKKNGAFTGNFRDAMSKGQITSEEFNKALLQLGSKPVAVEAAKSTKTFEGAIGSMQAGIVSAGAAILEKLQPAITGLATWIGNAASFLTPFITNMDIMIPVLATLGALILAAVIPSLVAWATAQWAVTAAMLASPVTWIILGIALLIAGIVLLIMHWSAIVKFLQDVWGAVVDWLLGTLQTIADFWVSVWNNIIGFFKGVWSSVTNWFMSVWNSIVSFIQTVLAAIGAYITAYLNAYIAAWKMIWTAILTAAQAIWGAIVTGVQNFMGLIKGVVSTVMSALTTVWSNAWTGLKAVPVSIWNFINNSIFTPFKDGIGLIAKSFENGATAIGKAWDKIKSAAGTPVNFVLDTIWNNGLRSFWNGVMGNLGLGNLKLPEAKLVKFASGGVLPGYTPGRDVHQFYSPTGGNLALSGGEAIMRPEFTRAVGGAAGVARLNMMARKGQAFASGGVWGGIKGVASSAWNTVKNVADSAADFATDPKSAIQKRVIDTILKPLMANVPGGIIGQGVAELPLKMAQAMMGHDFAPKGQGVAGEGWAKMWATVHKAFPQLVMTSNLRSAAQNAAVGGAKGSYHTLGRAIDLIPASMDTFHKVKGLFPNATELIYTPAGMEQLRNGKPFAAWSAAVQAQHYNHVHLAMKNGGVFPGLAKGGTVTGAGTTLVGENGPELLTLPKGAQVDPDFDSVGYGEKGVTFNNYAPLGQSPAQALTEFSNRAKGIK